ncbi:hypothetical protein B0H16DRAFT_1277965, partial [Mycena metata]
GETEADVRLRFSKTEQADSKLGVPSLHDVSPSSFIVAGLDLEEEQRRVRVQAELKRAQTTEMQIDLGALRTKLNRAISRFRKIQQAYMPVAVQALGAKALPANTLAEDVPLMLPSALTPEQRELCMGGVEHIEAMMRNAQCRSSLVRLRNQLHIKSRLLVYKKGHARHQGANTRSRTIVTRNQSKVRLHSEKYQTAWEAIRLLQGGDPGKVGYRALKREDIRSEEDEDMDWEDDEGAPERGPENQRQISWIWTEAGADGTDAGLEKALRIEWSKAFARTRRWNEEVRLLHEEYRRVRVSLEYEAAKWDTRAAAARKVQDAGAVGYALRQADMYRDLKA